MNYFIRKHINSVPLLIIKKEKSDESTKAFNTIEETISDLANDPNIPVDAIEKLRSSVKKLKEDNSIKIKNGEIL